MRTITYQLATEINRGTPEEPDLEVSLAPASMPYTEANYQTALSEAYNGEVTIEDVPDPPKTEFIPAPEQSAVSMMRAAFASQVADMEDDTILRCSGLADDWTPGIHKASEIYNAENQTWECFADYDNNTYPDVKPGDPSWFTFNRPLHGKSMETARPWVKPENGTTDIYHLGEYMVFTDGYTYKAMRDTNFSPEEYPADWEKVD